MSQSERSGKADRELHAIGAILRALQGLDGDSIQRVLDYVFSRLSIGHSSIHTSASSLAVAAPASAGPGISRPHQQSIRDLKEEKKPDSSNQMAALVAYYLAEVAPEGERKPAIGASDIEKMFKQARFNLPKKIGMALPNAAAAGYFDSIGNGMYKLNPVGYNLIAHGLPRDPSKIGSTPRKAKKRSRR